MDFNHLVAPIDIKPMRMDDLRTDFFKDSADECNAPAPPKAVSDLNPAQSQQAGDHPRDEGRLIDMHRKAPITVTQGRVQAVGGQKVKLKGHARKLFAPALKMRAFKCACDKNALGFAMHSASSQDSHLFFLQIQTAISYQQERAVFPHRQSAAPGRQE